MILVTMIIWCVVLFLAAFVAGWCSASIALSHKVDSWRNRCEQLEVELSECVEQ